MEEGAQYLGVDVYTTSILLLIRINQNRRQYHRCPRAVLVDPLDHKGYVFARVGDETAGVTVVGACVYQDQIGFVFRDLYTP